MKFFFSLPPLLFILLSFLSIPSWFVPPLPRCSVVMIACVVDDAAGSYDTCKSCFNDVVDTFCIARANWSSSLC